jgi:hypothetical protein
VVFSDKGGLTEVVPSLRGGARTNARGEFTVQGLVAGRYLVAAVTSATGLSEPLLARLRSQATPVIVTEKATAVVRLTVVK